MEDLLNGHRAIDADRHVVEPIDLFRENLPAELRHEALTLGGERDQPGWLERVQQLGPRASIPLPPPILWRGRPLQHNLSLAARIELAHQCSARPDEIVRSVDPRYHLAVMDRQGIEAAFILPTLTSYLVYNDSVEPQLAAHFAEAYHRWLAQFCAADPARLRGVTLLPLGEPALTLTTLRRNLERGFRAICLRPNPLRGRTLSDPLYDSLWRACEEHDVSVLVHEGTHAQLVTTGADRFSTRFALHACSHPMEHMMALLALIEGGVLERHPRLKLAFLEAGAGWLPYWLWRLDEMEFAQLGGEVAERVRLPPSQYFRRQCWVSVEPSEPRLDVVAEAVGADRLLFGSDFPHPDHATGALAQLLRREDLSGEQRRALLRDNACALFGLP